MEVAAFSAVDTIAAVATPPGPGALAVVRVSGPEARAILGMLALASACSSTRTQQSASELATSVDGVAQVHNDPEIRQK